MKPETEALLQQCRTALLQQSNERIAALLAQWFELMIGEESVEEIMDDLCLLLDYRVQSHGSSISYATYTSWWEVEGYLEASDGEFFCRDVASLSRKLQAMSVEEFYLLIKLAFQVRVLYAEMDGLPGPPTGHEFLREMGIWLTHAGTEREHTMLAALPSAQPERENREQRRQREKEQAALACQQGYLFCSQDMNHWVRDTYRHWCKDHDHPSIIFEAMAAHFAKITIDFKTLRSQGEGLPIVFVQEKLSHLTHQYLARSHTRPQAHTRAPEIRLHWTSKRSVTLEGILIDGVEELAGHIVALWPAIRQERQLPEPPASVLAHKTEPGWRIELQRLQARDVSAPAPLSEEIILPANWQSLLSRDHLLAFLAFLGCPGKTNELKATLGARVEEQLKRDPVIYAQFFELFCLELAVPPWELETLLTCTTTERKRWVAEGKLPVLAVRNFRQATYPVFDRRTILSLQSAQIELWRTEYQDSLKEKRSTAALTAAARKAQQLQKSS